MCGDCTLRIYAPRTPQLVHPKGKGKCGTDGSRLQECRWGHERKDNRTTSYGRPSSFCGRDGAMLPFERSILYIQAVGLNPSGAPTGYIPKGAKGSRTLSSERRQLPVNRKLSHCLQSSRSTRRRTSDPVIPRAASCPLGPNFTRHYAPRLKTASWIGSRNLQQHSCDAHVALVPLERFGQAGRYAPGVNDHPTGVQGLCYSASIHHREKRLAEGDYSSMLRKGKVASRKGLTFAGSGFLEERRDIKKKTKTNTCLWDGDW